MKMIDCSYIYSKNCISVECIFLLFSCIDQIDAIDRISKSFQNSKIINFKVILITKRAAHAFQKSQSKSIRKLLLIIFQVDIDSHAHRIAYYNQYYVLEIMCRLQLVASSFYADRNNLSEREKLCLECIAQQKDCKSYYEIFRYLCRVKCTRLVPYFILSHSQPLSCESQFIKCS